MELLTTECRPLRGSLKRIAAAACASVLCAAVVHAQASERKARTRTTTRPHAATTDSMQSALAHTLTARSIGPAVMGGRVSTIALDPKTPTTFYAGLGMGNLMKTTDNGITFTAIFDHEKAGSIGDVEIAPSDPRVLWLGSGEANDRNSVSYGNGVYRSTDAGATWKNVGLKDSKAIARIAVHPTDPNTAYAAVVGDLWMPNAERGLYKTSDAGATWRKVLSAPAPYDTRVGAGEVAIDPSNPNIVYAAMYARQRQPWGFKYGPQATDGKDLGGIFKSEDAGATWHKLGGGLPSQTGRIGLSVYAKDPKIVYAVVQSDSGGQVDLNAVYSKEGGVFRTEDGGAHWTRVSKVNPRPFYFSQIRVDPTNPQRVYLLSYVLLMSDDGGQTWREDRFTNVHPDAHALVVDPANPKHLLIGTDGGLFQSFNEGTAWEHLDRFAAGEVYRVNVDRSTPFRICGGLQDNTNWVGPSDTRSGEGIRNGDWQTLQGGDGSYCAFDPTDSTVVYAESQQASVRRVDLKTGQITMLRPQPNEGAPAFRFNWLAPMIMSQHETGTLYLGGNVIFKLTNHGENWTVISPDLSTNDLTKMRATGSGAETYGTVFTIAESPVKAGVLWAGTDDGKVWRTIDDGAHWTDLSAKLPAAVRGRWINRIEAGHADVNVAYVVANAHRDGIYSPIAYRTTDGAATWKSISGNLPADEPMRVVREDPENANVLYAGTEHGLWLSLDAGVSWGPLGDLPTTPVADILIEPKTHSIVIATQGRSIWIIDQARAFSQLTPAVLSDTVHLFAPEPALEYELLPSFDEWTGSAQFRGKNPPVAAMLTYYVRRATGESATIDITTKSGTPVAHLTGPAVSGLNRVAWNLKPTSSVLASYGGAEGAIFVHPGAYTVTISYGHAKRTQPLEVRALPGIVTK
jgi:photosystem II stability/assembly factor-like uncharacterized protein